MKKNDIFTFTAPNGVEVAAVCLRSMGTIGNITQYLCYGQNRLFTMNEFYSEWVEETGEVCKDTQIGYGEIILEHLNVPDYDVVLEDYHQQHEEEDEKTKQRQIKEAWNSYTLIEDYYYPIEECFPRENYLDNWLTNGYYIKQIADDYNKAEEERCPINTEKY